MGGGGRGSGLGVRGSCRGGGGGVRVDVNEELKFLKNFTKNKSGAVRWGSGWWGRVRVDVNTMLGVGGDVGYGGCEPRNQEY